MRDKASGAIAARWQAKAGVEPPFAGCERPFSLETLFSINELQLKRELQFGDVPQPCRTGFGRFS